MTEVRPPRTGRPGDGAPGTPRGGVPRHPRLGYEPSLDGLRAVAVLAVLVYHARFDWMPGGFLGVSTFFTLSGFLITSLMLQEWRASGSISLRGFFTRRFRRLLPASWLTLAAVVAMGAVGVWTTEQLRDLRGDVPWSLAELANWHFIAEDRSYGAQFAAPSPLEHFWSLAVEQQFYLLLPLVVLAALRWSRRRSVARGAQTRAGPAATRLWPLVAVLVVAAAASATLNGLLAGESVSRSYFGTDTRLAELAAGALLACLGLGTLRGGDRRRRLVLQALGLCGLAVSAALWATANVGDRWLYPWGLLLTATASSTLIVGALQRGVLARALSTFPLVALGRVSYGVYLLHWPVFLWLTPARVGWGQWPLFGLRMAVTLGAALVMFRLLESPVRTRTGVAGRIGPRVAVPAATGILVATALVTAELPAPSELAVASEEPAATTTLPPVPTRVLVVGDELAGSWIPLGAEAGTETHPLELTVAAAPGCGVALGGLVRLSDGEVERDTDRCGAVRDQWLAAAGTTRPDVVLVWAAPRDVADRRLDSEAPWVAPGDPGLDDFLSTEVRELAGRLADGGAAVVVATAPHMASTVPAPEPAPPVLSSDPTRAGLVQRSIAAAAQDAPPPGHAENDPARIDRWNELLRAAAASGSAVVLDTAAEMAAWPGGEFDPQRRAADGVGLTEVGITELATALAPRLAAVRPPLEAPDVAAEVAAQVPLPAAPPPTPRRTVPPGRRAEILVVGDSVAFNVGYGLTSWAAGTAAARVESAGQLGCPVARGGQFRFLRDIDTFPERCEWAEAFPAWVASTDPEVVVLASGIWEVVDRRLPGDDRFRSIGSPEVDRYILSEFLRAIDTLAARGATVVLLTYPRIEAGRDQGYSGLPESEPARVDRLNELLAEAVALRPGVATLVDFRSWLAARPGGEMDPAIRDDGVHFTDDFSREIGRWLGPQLLGIAATGPPAAG